MGGGLRAVVAVLWLAGVVVVPSTTRADDASEAQLHFDLGTQLYGQRRYEEALEHFLSSNRLVPNASVVGNIAATYERLRRWPDAFNWYETYLRDFETSAQDQARARDAQTALRRRVAVISVATEPDGATLYVDRVDLGSVGVAPRQVAVTPGDHAIVARLEGHREARHEWTARAGASEEVALELEAILGVLVVRSEPEGAEVFVEGRDTPLGATPLEVSLGVGPRRLTLRRAGYGEVSREVTIADGQTATVEVEMSRLATTVAGLSVTSPRGARVTIDGEEAGVAPLTLDEVVPGTHRVGVDQPGLEPWTDELVFEAGGVTRIAATLEDPSSLHFEDLRLIGYLLGGAAFLAGAGVGVAGWVEREAFFEEANPTRGRLDTIEALNITADALMISGVAILGTTLILDLAIGGRPRSRADVVVDR